jgi:hypothetical protein
MEEEQGLKKEKLNKLFLKALDISGLNGFDYSRFPLKIENKEIRPNKIILYIWQITDPPGGRSIDENKIQIILPGQKRGERADFAHKDDFFTLLVGFRKDIEIFCLWDSYLYEKIPFSRNVQVKEKTLFNAINGGIQYQKRKLWVGPELIIATNKTNLKKAINKRYSMYLGIDE